MNTYTISHLSVSFGGVRVLAVDDLSIRSQTVTVLFGPSGAGKSTFLRALNRLNDCFPHSKTTGEITINLDGRAQALNSVNEEYLRRKAAMVFQHPNVLPVSIEKNFTLPLIHGAGLRKDEALNMMENKLKSVGLWDEVADRLKKDARELSGGQQQRLCLARALSLSPEILLLDEPTSSLDAKAAAVVEEYIAELAKGLTVVAVTHDAAQKERLGKEFLDITQINKLFSEA
jgi:phosphate transport system ATP-binding protein